MKVAGRGYSLFDEISGLDRWRNKDSDLGKGYSSRAFATARSTSP
jgi:hypothetical protein